MTTGRLQVRLAEAEDREEVARVLLDAYGQYEEALAGERWEQYKANILEAVDAPTTLARFVAEVDGRIVGSVFVYATSTEAYGAPQLQIHNPIIRLLGVTREARGLGVATELIRASAKLAREGGADSLHLHTSDLMDSAVRLYERLGFERAYDKEFHNGNILVKSYRLRLEETALLEA
ncbi:GNAT family N-acetyltransferase [Cohnella sp. GCM10027633]|uniref:GNAT family N-acetyltransferase n=1 Tax=unclassified Cohnella TaxID=2636738 RepID=UPI00363BB4F2